MGQISAHLAHEIRNPVGSVALLASTLLKRVDIKNKTLVLEIKKSIWRVERIVKATLLFSKGVQIHKSEIIPQNIQNEIQESLNYYTYSKNINFIFRFDDEVFEADFDLLCIVLQNFLFNAIDAIEESDEEEGIVEIEYHKNPKEVIFKIYDNGKPIENPQILFEPFKSTKLKGNGLGLALSLQIIEAHNGPLGRNALKAAKDEGVPIRIYHAHGADLPFNMKWPLKYYCMKMLRYSMNEHFVCSVKAGQFYMGKEIMKRGDYHFIPNAIEVGKFVFDPAVRNRIRRNFQLEGKDVIGHVGRFSLQKNHKFLLELFAIIHKQRPQTRLVLIGDGEWHERVMRQINSLGIRDAVVTPGSVSNPNEWYQAFDLFVLPSLWEGLPVVGVEAQTAGLPCIFSTAVTNEVALTGNAYFLPLDVSKDIWVRKINECFNSKVPRQDMTQTIINAHYDIATEALSLEKLYLQYAEKIGLR